VTDKPTVTDVEKLDLRSHDIPADKREELLRLFPEIRTEGGKVDFERLKATLGETVDVGKERYGMTWPGKAECFRAIQAPSIGTLRPAREESVEFDTTENLIIEGDNLEVLKLLSGQRAPSRAAGAVAALGVGAAVRDCPIADGAADSLLAPARFDCGFGGVELGVEVGLRRSNQFPQEGDASRGRLFGAVLAERIRLALRFTNEVNEPGRGALR